jgi:DNA mismatch repair protein MutS2
MSENASVQFDTDTLRPTYHLFIGTPGSSNALAIAKRLGMPKEILNQAYDSVSDTSDGTSDLFNQIQKTREIAEQRRHKANMLLDRAKHIRQKASARLTHLQDESQRLHKQADLEIDRTMRQVRDTIDRFRREMQNAPKPWHETAQHLVEQIYALSDNTPLAVRHMAFIRSLRPGDSVYAIPFRRLAMVDRIRHKRQTVVLLLDSKQLELPFDQVARPELMTGDW